jgi:hypothetical protein
MRTPFEDGHMAEASAQAEILRNAILTIGRADAVRSADPDILTRIGMLGEDPDADLAAAREALGQGDIDAAMAAAADATRAWTGAWEEGRRRAMLALAGVATLLIIVSVIAGAFRRNRHPAKKPVRRDQAHPL